MYLVENQRMKIKIVSSWQMQQIVHCVAYIHNSVICAIAVNVNNYKIFIHKPTAIKYFET